LRCYYNVSKTIQLFDEQLAQQKACPRKLRAELEGKRGKLCQYYKGFRHLARNYRNKEEGEKGTDIPQNKFEVLKSRVMQCGVRKKIIRRIGVVEVECYKCGEMGHKYRECSLWKKAKEEKRRVEKRTAHIAIPQKTQQKERLACSIREKMQEAERTLRRAEEEEVVHMAKLQDVQRG